MHFPSTDKHTHTDPAATRHASAHYYTTIPSIIYHFPFRSVSLSLSHLHSGFFPYASVLFLSFSSYALALSQTIDHFARGRKRLSSYTPRGAYRCKWRFALLALSLSPKIRERSFIDAILIHLSLRAAADACLWETRGREREWLMVQERTRRSLCKDERFELLNWQWGGGPV